MSQNDSAFFKTFAVVLGALVAFTVFCIVVANMVSPNADHSNDPVVQQAIRDRAGPVGRSRVEAAAPAVAEQPAAPSQADDTDDASSDSAAGAVAQAATEEPADANAADNSSQALAVANSNVQSEEDFDVTVRAVVATNCAGCHEKGVTGAQRFDDIVSWNKLADKGIDALTASVISGKGNMPPRAETSLDDEQLREAVKYTLFLAAANADGESAANAGDSAVAAVVSNDDAGAEPAAEPEQVPAEIKTVVDSVCAACHGAGVANAPKYGDREAWDARVAAGGIDALLASSIAGKGAMPPRGGTNLTDEQLKLAIGYILSK